MWKEHTYAEVFTFLRPDARSAPHFKAWNSKFAPSFEKVRIPVHLAHSEDEAPLPPDPVRLCMRAHTFGKLRPALSPATLEGTCRGRTTPTTARLASGATAGS